MKRFLSLVAATAVSIAAFADNSKYVDPFMGTAGDHGQVSPAAQVPLGLASVCPDCIPMSHSGYDYDIPAISGISVTRISGVGGYGSGGNLSIRPASADYALEIVKGTEKAVPGYYETILNNGVGVRLTASHNIAFESYTFPKDTPKVMSFRFDSAIDSRRSKCEWHASGDNAFEGWCMSSTVGNAGAYTLYFRIETSEPFEITGSTATNAAVRFADGVKDVEVRVALSPVDEKTAAQELELCSTKSFDTVRKDAAKAWSEVLSKVDVKGSTKEQRILFYTSLYRMYLSPFHATSHDGRYRGTDGEVHKAEGWTYYSEWSMWDTFRTKFPMFCLLDPDRMSDMCRSLVSLYCTGKKDWATPHECVPTVRTEHSQVTLLDAWSKGVRGFDLAKAFPAMEKEYDDVLKPRLGKSPDQKMETIYDLWAMSRIADIIGSDAASEKYAMESEVHFDATWKKEFMTITDNFAQMKNNGMYQGSRWQYRWAMPIYVDRMKEWVDEETLADQLSEFFDRHLFNQGNEPDLQTPFMFNLFGHPERTDAVAHSLLTDDSMVHVYGGNAEFPEPYIGRAFQDKVDGYVLEMDEDDGTMSAWYMFCQMGFYPVCVGTDRYEMFTPLFSKTVLHLKGHDVTIRRRCGEAASEKVTVDGRLLDSWTITHAQLTGARKIVFE